MNLFLGIDGGGTRTRSVLVDETGRVCGSGRGGPANYHSVGLTTTRQSVDDAIRSAWQAAGLERRPASGLFLGLAGLGTAADRARLRALVDQTSWADPAGVGIHHDIHITLAGGLAGAPGIAIIAGTGSACYGCNAGGDTWQAGGWGYLLDDPGSGYQLALDGMRAVIRAVDGRGPATRLTEVFRDALDIADERGLIERLHQGTTPRAVIAGWARLVCETADGGDDAARAVLERGAAELALAITAVARKLGMHQDALAVTYAGGVLENSAAYRDCLAAELVRGLPSAHLTVPRLEPVLGAALCALRSGGIAITDAVIERLGAPAGTPKRGG